MFVRPEQPGVTLDLDKWSAFGQRGTASGEVRLDGVVVDADAGDRGGHAAGSGRPARRACSAPFDQALHAAIDIGIARAALEDGAEFVRTRSRPWKEAVDAGIERADEEPHVVRRFGEFTARLYALEALLARGTALIDEAYAQPELTRDAAAEATLEGRRRQGAGPGVRRRDRQRHIRTDRHLGHRRRGSTWTGTGATCVPTRCTTPPAGSTSTSATTPCTAPSPPRLGLVY